MLSKMALDVHALGRAALACSDLVKTLWPDAVVAAGGEVERPPKAADLVHRKLTDLVSER